MKKAEVAAKWMFEVVIPLYNKGINIIEDFGIDYNSYLADSYYYGKSNQRKMLEAFKRFYKKYKLLRGYYVQENKREKTPPSLIFTCR